jgi:hypothetical protein
LLFCSVAVLLAGCGGGGDAASAAEGAAVGVNAPAPTSTGSTSSSGWTVVANENEAFSLSAARVVRYGTGTVFSTQTVPVP